MSTSHKMKLYSDSNEVLIHCALPGEGGRIEVDGAQIWPLVMTSASEEECSTTNEAEMCSYSEAMLAMHKKRKVQGLRGDKWVDVCMIANGLISANLGGLDWTLISPLSFRDWRILPIASEAQPRGTEDATIWSGG
jgi:hypothetical protein